MPGYHKYVFDLVKRRFVGRFEEMYQAERQEGFDSWHQDDLNARVDVELCQRLLGGRSYSTLIDLGCGKGALTATLAAFAQRAVGFDISMTAIKIAESRYPNIEFHTLDIADPEEVSYALLRYIVDRDAENVVVLAQVLSYLENWRELLRAISLSSVDLLVLLYVPEDPIGYVKSMGELLDAVKDRFGEMIYEQSTDAQVAILARSRRKVESV